MPLLHTDPSSDAASPAPPELPEGWHYTDDLIYDDVSSPFWRRRITLSVLIGALVVVCVVGLVVLNAATHYSRGVAALDDRSYAQAEAELSSARLLVIPYRDAQVLADEARRQLLVQAAGEEKVRQRVDAAIGALDDAAARLDARDVPGALAALQALRAGDLRAALRDSAELRDAAAALTKDMTAAAQQALREFEWGRAAGFAAAMLVLEPSSAEAAALAARAGTGEELSARLTKAKDAARNRQWRKALRLALAVTAVREGFPGAAAVIADARKALAPKPKVTQAATASTTTPATSAGGASSGSSSAPPPP
jgi:hypothetical protein